MIVPVLYIRDVQDIYTRPLSKHEICIVKPTYVVTSMK